MIALTEIKNILANDNISFIEKLAQKAKADRLAPDLFRKAENYYLLAKKDYKEGYYDACIKHATQSRITSEKAEYETLLKKAKLKTQNPDEEY